MTPSERKVFIRKEMSNEVHLLAESGKFYDWKIIYERGQHVGIKGNVKIAAIEQIASSDNVQCVRIEKTNGVKKRKSSKKSLRFFCIKMTVGIQIEGKTQGIQNYEERYVLFEADSSEEAFDKAQKTIQIYEEPYLNSDGLLVRWKVEGLDDAYDVSELNKMRDFRRPEGVEVFKGRKLNSDRVWQVK